MTRRVTSYVHVVDVGGGRAGVFGPDDKVPAWAVALIDNESVWGDDDGEPESSEKPAGNSSIEAWQEYARSKGATDADLDGKSRNELREQYGN